MDGKKPRVIIIGAGQTGRYLADKLAHDWEVTIVDTDENKLSLLEDASFITKVKGDATSRLVLKNLQISDASYVVIATGNDEVNLEVARLSLEMGAMRIIAVSVNVKRNEEYLKLGIEVVNRAHAVTGILFSKIEKGKVVASGIGLGKGEIVEVTVLPGSVVAGKKLSELRPKSWLVGAVYRKEEFIVPHGDTVIQVGDRLLLIGNPEVIKVIAELLRTGSPEFPLQYGTNILVYVPPSSQTLPVKEIEYLYKNTRAYNVEVSGDVELCTRLDSDLNKEGVKTIFKKDSNMSLSGLLEKEDVGFVVIPPVHLAWHEILGLKKPWIAKVFDTVSRPVLIPKGTFPYEKITLYATNLETLKQEAELAIDIARLLKAELTVATVITPEVTMNEKVKIESQHILSEALQISLMHGIKIQEVCLEGNPIEEMAKFSESQNLLIIGHKKGVWNHIFKPDVSLHLAARSRCSCIVVPYGE